MKIGDVMRRRVATCRPETNLAEATALMWNNDCGILPVVTESGQLVGVVTDRDMCIASGTRNIQASDILVRDIVGERLLFCSPSESIHVALRRMSEGKVRRLPVVGETGQLEGILSLDDLVLDAKSGAARLGSAISYGDVVETLRAICARDIPPYAGAAAA